MTAASRAFREHGFHRASAEAIAAQAGFTRGALYANFEGKEGLFLAVLDEEIAARAALADASGPPRRVARRYVELLDADPGWTLALLEFTIHAARDPELAERLRARNREIRALMSRMLRTMRPGMTARRAERGANLAMAANTGVALERALEPDAAGVPELTLAYAAALAG